MLDSWYVFARLWIFVVIVSKLHLSSKCFLSKALSHSELPPCDWTLGLGGRAEQEYRQFVKWGIGKQSVWTDVRGQTILGEEDFADRFIDHLKKHKEVPEITRSQKYLKRPALEKLFSEDILRNKRDRRIADAVERHGYLQREIADHLGLNYATVSRLVSAQDQNIK
jgi:hypothetical protein